MRACLVLKTVLPNTNWHATPFPLPHMYSCAYACIHTLRAHTLVAPVAFFATALVHTQTHTNTHTQTHTPTPAPTPTSRCAHTHTLTHTHTHTSRCARTHTHTHTHTRLDTHTHTVSCCCCCRYALVRSMSSSTRTVSSYAGPTQSPKSPFNLQHVRTVDPQDRVRFQVSTRKKTQRNRSVKRQSTQECLVKA
jgi:hypothetical protein